MNISLSVLFASFYLYCHSEWFIIHPLQLKVYRISSLLMVNTIIVTWTLKVGGREYKIFNSASEQTINEIKSALNEFFAISLNVEKKILY